MTKTAVRTPGRYGDSAPIMEASSLSKNFGSVQAVSDLSFSLERGTVTGFLGPNGAGKTTTLRMLLGLAAPTSGRVRVFGKPYAELDNPASRVGAVLEATDFHPSRSGRDHLRVLALSARIPLTRVDEVLSLVGLGSAAHRRVKEYSLGMRQRLGLAAALLGDPELLVLDEPANGLDPEGMRWLRDFLREYAAQGRTVFISSHVLAEIAQTVDRVLIISRGKLVAESSLEELTEQAGATVQIRTPAPDRMEEALGRASLRFTAGEPEVLKVYGATVEQVGDIAFRAGVPVYGLAPENSSLEEVFLELTGGGVAA